VKNKISLLRWMPLLVLIVIGGFYLFREKFYTPIQSGYMCPFQNSTGVCMQVVLKIDAGGCDDEYGCVDPTILGYTLMDGKFGECLDSQKFSKKEYLCTDQYGMDWNVELTKKMWIKK